jgi:hypothetical protein
MKTTIREDRMVQLLNQYRDEATPDEEKAGIKDRIFNYQMEIFNDLQMMETRVRRDAVEPGDALLYKAGLWVKLDKLSHAEVYYRYATAEWINSTSAYAENESPLLFDLSDYGPAAKVYNEVAGYITQAGTPCAQDLFDLGVSDSGIIGSLVTGSRLSFDSLVKEVKRSPSSLSLTSGHRYGMWVEDSLAGDSCVLSESRIVISF